MDLAVLADLELGEMEAERLDLPAEVLDLAPGHPRESVVGQGQRDLVELAEQGGRRRVATGERRATLTGQDGPGPAESFGDGPEPLAVRLVGEPPLQLAHRLGQRLVIARESSHQ